ncbi:unnamed protein product [marine sediment metagenome]|uniref:Uncharacterized protein n=1 Tax=marine sediment metagenome TaxID=412755 RepID=X1D9T0_9ZZZZ
MYGEKGSLEWLQMEPNTLIARWLDRPAELIRPGSMYSYLSKQALHSIRLPAGHPEGFIEAFANIYRNYILALKSILDGKEPEPEYLDFPSVKDGVRGMAFIETVVESNRSDRKWTRFKS